MMLAMIKHPRAHTPSPLVGEGWGEGWQTSNLHFVYEVSSFPLSLALSHKGRGGFIVAVYSDVEVSSLA